MENHNHIAGLVSHLLRLTYLRDHTENVSKGSVVLFLLINRLRTQSSHSSAEPVASRSTPIINLPRGYSPSLWALTGFTDSVALLRTGGRTRLGSALMTTRTPLHFFSAGPGGVTELMPRRTRGCACSGVLKRQATSR